MVKMIALQHREMYMHTTLEKCEQFMVDIEKDLF